MKIEWTYLQVFDDGGLHHTWLAWIGPIRFTVRLEWDGMTSDKYYIEADSKGGLAVFSIEGAKGYTRLDNAKRGAVRLYERLIKLAIEIMNDAVDKIATT